MFLPFSSLLNVDVDTFAKFLAKHPIEDRELKGLSALWHKVCRDASVNVLTKNVLEIFEGLDIDILNNIIIYMNQNFNLGLSKDNLEEKIREIIVSNFPLRSEKYACRLKKSKKLSVLFKNLSSLTIDNVGNEVVDSVKAVFGSDEE